MIEEVRRQFRDDPGIMEGTSDLGAVAHTILTIGVQDVDMGGLQPSKGIEILGGSSDHLVVTSGIDNLAVGTELKFQLDYSALLRAMTSPFVGKSYRRTGNISRLRQIA